MTEAEAKKLGTTLNGRREIGMELGWENAATYFTSVIVKQDAEIARLMAVIERMPSGIGEPVLSFDFSKPTKTSHAIENVKPGPIVERDCDEAAIKATIKVTPAQRQELTALLGYESDVERVIAILELQTEE
jgi:hypothetical protein